MLSHHMYLVHVAFIVVHVAFCLPTLDTTAVKAPAHNKDLACCTSCRLQRYCQLSLPATAAAAAAAAASCRLLILLLPGPGRPSSWRRF
jgi:hypothetical protein